jgi:hypothetical protein
MTSTPTKANPVDFEADRLFWSYWGTPLFNAMLNAEAVLDASL